MPARDEIILRTAGPVETAGELSSQVDFRRVFEGTTEGVLLLDAATGIILDVNPFLCHLLGYEKDAFAGRQFWTVGAFRGIATDQAAWDGFIDGGFIHCDDLPLATREGATIAVELWSNAYSWAGKKVIQCNIRDITERKAHVC